MQITVADEKPTRGGEKRLAPEIASPLIHLDFSRRGEMTIHFGPNPTNERENGLPRGMRGVKIWYCWGGIPENEDDWRWLTDDTNSPYRHNIPRDKSGPVAYKCQYFDNRMQLGPMSDPATANVTQ